METEWRVARAKLRELLREKPQASHRELATRLGYSIGWVRKWRPILAQSSDDDETVLLCKSHRPKHIPKKVSEKMELHIVALRASLSEQYNRKVGARTMAAYLKQEQVGSEEFVPSSPATIWRILRRRQVILVPTPATKQPLMRPEPGLFWEIDFCTAARQSPEAPNKKENALEVFNVVDRGSSATMASQASTRFDAEQSLLSMAEVLQNKGSPVASPMTAIRASSAALQQMDSHPPLPVFYYVWAVTLKFCQPTDRTLNPTSSGSIRQ